jgi:hypothetical protein
MLSLTCCAVCPFQADQEMPGLWRSCLLRGKAMPDTRKYLKNRMVA